MAPTLVPRRRKFHTCHSTPEKSGPWTVGTIFVLSFGLICLVVLVLFVIYKTRKQRREIRQQRVNEEMEALARIREDQLEKARSRSRDGTADETRVIGPPTERESTETLITRPVQATIAPPLRMRTRMAPLRIENSHAGVWAESREYEERRPVSPSLPLLMISSRAPTYSSFPPSVHPIQCGKRFQNGRGNGKGRIVTTSTQPSLSILNPTATHPALLPSSSPPARVETPVKRRKLHEKPTKEWMGFQKDIPITLPLRLKNPAIKTSEQDQVKHLPPSEEMLGQAIKTPLRTTPTEEIENSNPKQTCFVEEILEEAIKTPLPTTPPPVLLTPTAEQELRDLITPHQQEIVYSSLQE